MTRRPATGGVRVLRVLAVVAVTLLLAAGGLVTAVLAGASTSTAGQVAFTRALAVPPLAPSHLDRSGRRVFDLRLRRGSSDLGQPERTETLGIDGDHLGPTLRAARGEQVVVNVDNQVGEESTLHWHGMHLPARMDGGPHQLIAPGQTWSPSWTVDQPAATLWYHPHLHGRTADQVYRGLAGMFILDDEDSARQALPHDYGVDDIPLIVQDKSFDARGQLDHGGRALSNVGQLGDTILVNGTPGPYLDVRTERVRLRLLNASNARIYDFGFVDDRRFDLVGTDGGLLAAPHRGTRIQLAPGERAEIVLAVAPGERPVLRSYPPRLGAGAVADRLAGGHDTFDVLQLRAADRLAPSPPVPARLAELPDPGRQPPAATRSFRLGDEEINGRKMDPSRIDEVVTVDTTEVWSVTNGDGAPHSFHIHDAQFRVLDQDGAPPPPELSGLKDTVYVAPGTTVRLQLRFADYTDPQRPYMFHCHLLEHEDEGMMGQFLVLAPGQRPAGPPPGHHH